MTKLLKASNRIHLVGIGGIGLSAIARVLHGQGFQVAGSDQSLSQLTQELIDEGIPVHEGHRADWVAGADLLIVSSAIPESNPEIVEAKRQGIPIAKREQILGELTESKITIAVAGAHGKTTTSAMIAWILVQAGLDPTYIVGGVLQNLGTNARAGAGPHFVIEADEYDRAFLGIRPNVAIVTVLEHDHPDCYPTFDEMRAAFREFSDGIADEGLLVVCGDDLEARRLGEWFAGRQRRVVRYGLDQVWDWWAAGTHLGNHAVFEVGHKPSASNGKKLGTCALQVPGRHNVLNALAALAASSEAGVDFETAAAALTRFQGTARRFQLKGQADGITVVDDYAHHPTEVRATLEAAQLKFPGRAIWAVFQPHTYSRTDALLNDFAASFGGADHVIVTRIYAAREQNLSGVSGRDLVAAMDHPDARYAETHESAITLLMTELQSGDVVITLGAGDSYLIGERVLEEIRAAGNGRIQPHGEESQTWT
jgi:UDP-N-acetylmuramate--alanine ligase